MAHYMNPAMPRLIQHIKQKMALPDSEREAERAHLKEFLDSEEDGDVPDDHYARIELDFYILSFIRLAYERHPRGKADKNWWFYISAQIGEVVDWVQSNLYLVYTLREIEDAELSLKVMGWAAAEAEAAREAELVDGMDGVVLGANDDND